MVPSSKFPFSIQLGVTMRVTVKEILVSVASFHAEEALLL